MTTIEIRINYDKVIVYQDFQRPYTIYDCPFSIYCVIIIAMNSVSNMVEILVDANEVLLFDSQFVTVDRVPCTGKYAAIRDLGIITGEVSWCNTIHAFLDDSGNFSHFL
jgi:hypothetical protein